MSTANRSTVVRLEPGPINALTDVPGISVGHFTHDLVYRGVTAILCEGSATAGVSVRGSNPGTIHTDALGPTTIGGMVHGIGLSGGSLFGPRDRRHRRMAAPAGDRPAPARGPDPDRARRGHLRSRPQRPLPAPDQRLGSAGGRGGETRTVRARNVGAGTGGTAGKGPGGVRTKGGLGTASLLLPGGIVVGALVVINALGSLVHPATGELYATSGGFDIPLLYHQVDDEAAQVTPLTNTTLGVVATNAQMDKPQLVKVADLVHDGLARAIRPLHAMRDGDTVFALSTHSASVTLPDTSGPNLTDLIGHAAADAMVRAVLDAVEQTPGIGEWPSVGDAQAAIRGRT